METNVTTKIAKRYTVETGWQPIEVIISGAKKTTLARFKDTKDWYTIGTASKYTTDPDEIESGLLEALGMIEAFPIAERKARDIEDVISEVMDGRATRTFFCKERLEAKKRRSTKVRKSSWATVA